MKMELRAIMELGVEEVSQRGRRGPLYSVGKGSNRYPPTSPRLAVLPRLASGTTARPRGTTACNQAVLPHGCAVLPHGCAVLPYRPTVLPQPQHRTDKQTHRSWGRYFRTRGTTTPPMLYYRKAKVPARGKGKLPCLLPQRNRSSENPTQ